MAADRHPVATPTRTPTRHDHPCTPVKPTPLIRRKGVKR